MAKRTLNDRIIRAIKPAPAGKRHEVWDALVPGLGLRTTETGAKTFVLATRYPGSLQSHTSRAWRVRRAYARAGPR